MTRIPIVREDADGTIIDGTAYMEADEFGGRVWDFRDLDGEPLVLPPGSSFLVTVDLEGTDGDAE